MRTKSSGLQGLVINRFLTVKSIVEHWTKVSDMPEVNTWRGSCSGGIATGQTHKVEGHGTVIFLDERGESTLLPLLNIKLCS